MYDQDIQEVIVALTAAVQYLQDVSLPKYKRQSSQGVSSICTNQFSEIHISLLYSLKKIRQGLEIVERGI